ncbi:MAG: hypothetical protein H0X39_00320 [Actinobacteria bacterium]|nr:hypothetical protein [Gemmatimonadaceae bacterium]MBA3841065.1 hypothetical protein [Actinomycetota bacterium]
MGKLADWLAAQPRGATARLARKTGLTYITVCRARDGHRIHKQTAELIAEALDGAVSADDMPHVKAGGHRDEDADDAEPRRVA